MDDISVVIPSHNARDYVGETIESVLAQTVKVAQVLVVDDSTDGSSELIAEYERQTDGLVELIRVDPCNVSQARNVGLERTSGRWIAMLDADDIWLPQKTEHQITILHEDPQAIGAFCGLFTFERALDDLGRRPWAVMQDRPSVEQVLMSQMVVASASLFRRDALDDILFDERTGHAEDTIFSADLALVGDWRCVQEPLLARRLHPAQATASPWHTVWNIETRVDWCRSRSERIGTDLAGNIESQLWNLLVEFIERRYWQRQFSELRSLRRKVAELCPQVLEQSPIAKRVIYPAWVYRLRDMFGRILQNPSGTR